MYEVLVYVYENYGGGEACPDRQQLGRRLSSAGFGRDDIQQALHWLDGLDHVAEGICLPPCGDAEAVVGAADASDPPWARRSWAPSPDSLRVYSPQELRQLGADGIACLSFLEDAGALAPELRELVIERALAASDAPLSLDDLKLIVMMVYWRLDASPGVLVLDELCDDAGRRLAH